MRSNEPETPISKMGKALTEELSTAIVKCVTPEVLQQVTNQAVEAMLGEALKLDTYHGLGEVITKRIHKEMERQLDTPEMKKKIETAVRDGIDRACEGATEQVKGKILDWTFKSMEKALEATKCDQRRW
jgi:hypothetical protein